MTSDSDDYSSVVINLDYPEEKPKNRTKPVYFEKPVISMTNVHNTSIYQIINNTNNHYMNTSSYKTKKGEYPGSFEELKKYYGDIVNHDSKKLCDICRSLEQENDFIFTCALCNCKIHQSCYGSELIGKEFMTKSNSTSQWFCQRCLFLMKNKFTPEKVQCSFCPILEGCLKRCKKSKANNKFWAHPNCVNWVPGLEFIDESKTEISNGLDPNRYKITCHLCNIQQGVCIQCDNEKCNFSFHIICGQNAGLIPSHDQIKLYDTYLVNKDFYLDVFCNKHQKPYPKSLRKELNKLFFNFNKLQTNKIKKDPSTQILNKQEKGIEIVEIEDDTEKESFKKNSDISIGKPPTPTISFNKLKEKFQNTSSSSSIPKKRKREKSNNFDSSSLSVAKKRIKANTKIEKIKKPPSLVKNNQENTNIPKLIEKKSILENKKIVFKEKDPLIEKKNEKLNECDKIPFQIKKKPEKQNKISQIQPEENKKKEQKIQTIKQSIELKEPETSNNTIKLVKIPQHTQKIKKSIKQSENLNKEKTNILREKELNQKGNLKKRKEINLQNKNNQNLEHLQQKLFEETMKEYLNPIKTTIKTSTSEQKSNNLQGLITRKEDPINKIAPEITSLKLIEKPKLIKSLNIENQNITNEIYNDNVKIKKKIKDINENIPNTQNTNNFIEKDKELGKYTPNKITFNPSIPILNQTQTREIKSFNSQNNNKKNILNQKEIIIHSPIEKKIEPKKKILNFRIDENIEKCKRRKEDWFFLLRDKSWANEVSETFKLLGEGGDDFGKIWNNCFKEMEIENSLLI